jgi:hypothetical protein
VYRKGVMMYQGEIRICEVWIRHQEVYGIACARLVAMFGDEGVEYWNAGVWKVSIPKKDFYRQTAAAN